MSENIKIESKNKINKKLLIGMAVFIAVALVAILVIFAPKAADAKKIQEQLSLGEKYLSELEYEQAIAAYLAVIEIDPKNVDAYLGLADVYVAQGEYDKAISVLEDALSNISEDAAIKEKLEEIRAEMKATLEATATPVPMLTNTPMSEPTGASTPTPTNTPTSEPAVTSTPVPTPEIAVQGEKQELFKCQKNGDGTITIIGVSDTDIVELVVPEEIDGKKVTQIAEGALTECKNLVALYLPSSLKKLGRGNSYYDCFGLPGSMESLQKINVAEENTAYNSINGVLYTKDMKELVYVPKAYEGNLVVPETVVNIHTYAMQDCRKLTEITFLASELFNGQRNHRIRGIMFMGCVLLEAINVSDANESYCSIDGILYEEVGRKRGERYSLVKVPAQSNKVYFAVDEIVTNIDSAAFYDCSLIETIKLHSNVRLNGISILYEDGNEVAESDNYLQISECTNLKEILVEEGNEEVCSIDGILYSTDGTELLHVPVVYEKANIVVPEGVKRISVEAFYNCKKIQSVVLPESLAIIWDNAFKGCESLTEIKIPENVKYIGNYAFEGCSNLNNVEILNPMIEMGENVFSGCDENLKVKEIVTQEVESYKGPFYWCRSIDGNTVWISDILYYDEIAQLQSIVLPSVIEGKTVIGISDRIFIANENLTSVILPDNIIIIDEYTFQFCQNLKEINIPEGCQIIGEGAFDFCENLMKAYIPSSVTSIEEFAFNSCPNLVIITPSGSYAEQYAIENGIPVQNN